MTAWSNRWQNPGMWRVLSNANETWWIIRSLCFFSFFLFLIIFTLKVKFPGTQHHPKRGCFSPTLPIDLCRWWGGRWNQRVTRRLCCCCLWYNPYSYMDTVAATPPPHSTWIRVPSSRWTHLHTTLQCKIVWVVSFPPSDPRVSALYQHGPIVRSCEKRPE